MNNFLLRTLTGIVFVTVIILGIWFSYLSMILLFILISTLGLWEFFSLVEQSGYKPHKIAAILISLFVWISLLPFINIPLVYLLLFPGALLLLELYKNSETPFINVAYTLLGLLYIVLPFYLFAWHSLNFYPGEGALVSYYPYLLLGVFFLIWSNDTFAYLCGRAFGKTKLFERVSPKKTQEGAIGGGICTVIIAIILSRFITEYTWRDWIVIALIVVVIGTIGDLVESMFKRSINIKDSGDIIPGHGGILDRFDSFILAAPFVFCYLLF